MNKEQLDPNRRALEICSFLKKKKLVLIKELKCFYAFSKNGDVYSLMNNRTGIKKVKPYFYKNGYTTNTLSINGQKIRFLTHRLIAWAFIKSFKIKDKKVVHHKNGIRHDNRVCNLEVITHSEHNKLNRTKAKKNKKTIAEKINFIITRSKNE